jgi:hypothetical protein
MEPIKIEENFKLICEELTTTKRLGVDELIKFLSESDFSIAPASAKYHLNCLGGLAQHTLNVLSFARMINQQVETKIDDNSIVLASLCHDLCKVNYYIEGETWDKKYKEETNQWRKMKVWEVRDGLPLGHGEKSATIAVTYVSLLPEELLAIRWHMGFSDPGVHFNYPSGYPFRDSLNKYPIVKVIMIADQLAELSETSNNE